MSSLSENNGNDDYQPNEVKDLIVERYLRWSAEKGGLDNARKVYKRYLYYLRFPESVFICKSILTLILRFLVYLIRLCRL